MVRKTKEQKAEDIIREDRAFPLKKGVHYEIFGVSGDTGTYEVRYDKLKDSYNCTCGNVKLISCSHILAVSLIRGDKRWTKNLDCAVVEKSEQSVPTAHLNQ